MACWDTCEWDLGMVIMEVEFSGDVDLLSDIYASQVPWNSFFPFSSLLIPNADSPRHN